jgi:uncharacterized membrane protein (UPF0182 family)
VSGAIGTTYFLEHSPNTKYASILVSYPFVHEMILLIAALLSISIDRGEYGRLTYRRTPLYCQNAKL